MPLLSRLRDLLFSRRTSPSGAPSGRPSAGERTATRPAPPRDQRARPVEAPVRFDYSPHRDGRPDPGEVVWAWVPYDENDGRGKDRPVLIVARDGDGLLGLTLTSKDHDRDADDEARWGRYWMDVGTGPWDAKRRPSEVRLDRILRLPLAAVRREGAALDRALFERVAQEAQRVQTRRGR